RGWHGPGFGPAARGAGTMKAFHAIHLVPALAALLVACGSPSASDAERTDTTDEHLSTVGGPVARSEMLDRAQNWVDWHIMYSEDQDDAAPDGDGHYYRPDCSGMVSMAWHLPKKSNGWDFNTGDFAGRARRSSSVATKIYSRATRSSASTT